MSNIVQHTHNKSNKSSNKSLWIVLITLAVIIFGLFILNSLLNKSVKKDTSVITTVSDNRYTMGNDNAKVRLVEYADFQCPACSVFSNLWPEVYSDIISKYGSSSVSLTYKYFPLVSIHQNAILSAESVEAAKDQGKFWELHDMLFAKQEDWSEALDAKSKIEGYAKDLGLDMNKFVIDRDSAESKNNVEKSLKEANSLQLDHTPTIFMNGVELKDLSLTKDNLEKIITDELNKIDGNTSTK